MKRSACAFFVAWIRRAWTGSFCHPRESSIRPNDYLPLRARQDRGRALARMRSMRQGLTPAEAVTPF
jgi:hypothetical protein